MLLIFVLVAKEAGFWYAERTVEALILFVSYGKSSLGRR